MNRHGNGKPEPIDPEQMLRMLEIEMMQQRARRQQASARRSNLRTVSFLFLFLVILGAAVAIYFAYTSGRVEELRARQDAVSSPTPAAATPRAQLDQDQSPPSSRELLDSPVTRSS